MLLDKALYEIADYPLSGGNLLNLFPVKKWAWPADYFRFTGVAFWLIYQTSGSNFSYFSVSISLRWGDNKAP